MLDFLRGTNRKRVREIGRLDSGGNLVLNWIGGQSARQIIQQATNLGSAWNAIYTNQPPTAVTNSLNITISNSSPRFYRIQITP